MNIKVRTSEGVRTMPLNQLKCVTAVYQGNILITKKNGEQVMAIELEF